MSTDRTLSQETTRAFTAALVVLLWLTYNLADYLDVEPKLILSARSALGESLLQRAVNTTKFSLDATEEQHISVTRLGGDTHLLGRAELSLSKPDALFTQPEDLKTHTNANHFKVDYVAGTCRRLPVVIQSSGATHAAREAAKVRNVYAACYTLNVDSSVTGKWTVSRPISWNVTSVPNPRVVVGRAENSLDGEALTPEQRLELVSYAYSARSGAPAFLKDKTSIEKQFLTAYLPMLKAKLRIPIVDLEIGQSHALWWVYIALMLVLTGFRRRLAAALQAPPCFHDSWILGKHAGWERIVLEMWYGIVATSPLLIGFALLQSEIKTRVVLGNDSPGRDLVVFALSIVAVAVGQRQSLKLCSQVSDLRSVASSLREPSGLFTASGHPLQRTD